MTSQVKDDGVKTLAPPAVINRRSSVASTGSQGSNPNKLGGAVAGLMGRRKSTLRSVAHSLQFMRRLTKANIEVDLKPKVKYENTYKMDPDKGTVFNPNKVEYIVNTVLTTYLSDVKYDPKICANLATDLSQIINNRIKDLKYKRYKIIVSLVIGERRDQGLEAASRCIWDASHDNFACVHYQNSSIFAVASIHGVYFE